MEQLTKNMKINRKDFSNQGNAETHSKSALYARDLEADWPVAGIQQADPTVGHRRRTTAH